jgi:hypothetical protein
MTDKPAAPPPASEPYYGPRSIPPGEEIYGRDEEIFELTNRLLANHVVLMHALSGAGKTSMIQAGLVPGLEEMGFHVLPVARVNRQPNLAGLDESQRQKINPFGLSALVSFEQAWPENQQIPLAELVELPLAGYLERRYPSEDPETGETRRILLIFDQFEELFTLLPTAHDAREDFFAWLMPVLYDVRYWTLFSMRDDFIGGLEPFLDYLPDRLSARFRLEFLRVEGALDAIRKPVEKFSATFEDKAALQLVKSLSKVTVIEMDQPREMEGRYVEPIQLQVVCLKLWRARANPGEISVEDVEKSGSVDTALADYYSTVLQEIAGDDLRLERNLRDWVQRQLIIEDSFRVPSLQRQLARYGLDQNVIQRLISAFLVRSEQRLGATWYELAHDRLVRAVVEDNRRWRERRLLPWQLAAERWNLDGRPAGSNLLLKGDALREARTGFNPSLASPLDLAFLQASEQAGQAHDSRWDDPERLQRVRLGTHLDEVGWGVIFAQDAPPELREALKELLEHRQAQAARNRELFFHVFDGLAGYRPGDTARTWLRRGGAWGGLPNPERVPYYLLLVGGPQSIPFEFQYELDQQYAVGRIYFERLEQYQSYARSVRVCEGGTVALPPRAAFFSPSFPGDRATNMVVESYSRPLAERLRAGQAAWQVELVEGAAASKAALNGLLGGAPTPALLVINSWGAGERFPPQDPRDLGAVLCSEWPGPEAWTGPLDSAHYFAVPDLAGEDRRLLGLVAAISGNYTAGAPRESDFAFIKDRTQAPPPEGPILARLPQELLGHPRGGALAVIAHVDKISTASYYSESGKVDIGVYQELLERLMQGYTVGAALELLNQRYALFNSLLQEQLQRMYFYDHSARREVLERMLRSALDARNYILLGDPAVRLPVDTARPATQLDPDWVRPEIEAVVPIQARPVGEHRPVPAPEQAMGELWYASGIDALTGAYALPPVHSSQLAGQLLGEPEDASNA